MPGKVSDHKPPTAITPSKQAQAPAAYYAALAPRCSAR
jgi:hypothetical protein